MSEPFPQRLRLVLAAVAIVAAAGATACGSSPTAPSGSRDGVASRASVTTAPATPNVKARRGGYNVVAD
jgi:hypothetical protein